MALFRRLFYRKPPDRLLEISERVYVFDCCFTADVLEEDEFKEYMDSIVEQLQDYFPDSSFMVFNFGEGSEDRRSQISDILTEYDMTVMDLPRQFEGCPLLPLEMIHHFLQSSDSWLSLEGHQNVLLVHCEKGGWPILAFMLAGLLLYRRQFSGEQMTLEMVYKQAPRDLLKHLSPLNTQPSHLRYLQYISRRNLSSEWPPADTPRFLDCIVLRDLPLFDGGDGCRPVIHVYGMDPKTPTDRSSKLLFSTSKTKKQVRYFQKEECTLVKIDVPCHIQGDVVLECIHLNEHLENEEMIFRFMFHTAFVRRNTLIFNHDQVDVLWDAKDQFPKDFTAEVLFMDPDAVVPRLTRVTISEDENEIESASPEEFFEAEEIFSNAVDALEGKVDDNSQIVHDNKPEQKDVQRKYPHRYQECATYDENKKQYVKADSSIDTVKDIAVDDVNYKLHKNIDSNINVVKDIAVDDGDKVGSVEFTIDVLRDRDTKEVTKDVFVKLEDTKDKGKREATVPLKTLESKLQKRLKTDVSRAKLDKILAASRKKVRLLPKPASDSALVKPKSKQLEPQGQLPRQAKPNSISRWIPPNKGSYTNSVHVAYPHTRNYSAPPVLSSIASLKKSKSVSYLRGSTGAVVSKDVSPKQKGQEFDATKPSNDVSSEQKGQKVDCTKPSDPPKEISTPPIIPTSLPGLEQPLYILPSTPSPLSPSPPPVPPPSPPPPRYPLLVSQSLKENTVSILPPSSSLPVIGDVFGMSFTASPPPSPPPPPFPHPSPVRSLGISKNGNLPSFHLQPTLIPPIQGAMAKLFLNGVLSVPPPPLPPPVCDTTSPPHSPLSRSSSPLPSPSSSPPLMFSSPPTPPPPHPSMSTVPIPPPPPLPSMCSASPPPSMSSVPIPPPPTPPLPHPAYGMAASHPMHGAPPPPPPPPPGGQVPGLPAPPGSHGGGPPPPPPFGAKGADMRGRGRGLAAAGTIPKRSSLKPLHWSKVSRVIRGSLWEELQRHGEPKIPPGFDASEFETLFAAVAPKRVGSGDKGNTKSGGAKTDKVHLVDLKRANNTEIMLTKVKMPLSDMMAAVLALDDTVLDVDQVENFIKFCPTKDEMELLKNYTGDKEALGKCEQFLMELMKVPRVESKLRVFSFKIQFQTQVYEFKWNLNTVNSACEEVRSSPKFKEIMKIILFLGNTLNQGTVRGAAVGFKLDSLLKLTETRASTSRMTLMHYLCKVLAEKNASLLDFHLDFFSLEAATKIQLQSLAEEMQAIIKGLERVKEELIASENDGPVSEVFRETLMEFISGAEAESESVTTLYNVVGRNADALALYFGEDPARYPFEQVAATILNFVKLFRKAHEENLKQAEQEKKKAEKEAEAKKAKEKQEAKAEKAEVKHEAEVEKAKEKQEAETEEAKGKQEAETEKANVKQEAEAEGAKEKQEAETEEAKVKHEAEVEKAEVKQEAEAEGAKEKQEAEIDEAKVKHEAEVEKAKEKQEAETEEAKVKHEAEVEKAKVKQEAEVEGAKVKHEAETEEAKGKQEAEAEGAKEKQEAETEEAKVKHEAEVEKAKVKQEAEAEGAKEKQEAETEETKGKQEAETEKAKGKQEAE